MVDIAQLSENSPLSNNLGQPLGKSDPTEPDRTKKKPLSAMSNFVFENEQH